MEQDLPVALRPETFDGYMADVERLVSRSSRPRPESAPGGDGAHYRHTPRRASCGEMAKLARQLGIGARVNLSETVDYLDAARRNSP